MTTSPKGNFIVTGGKDNRVRVCDFNDATNSHAELDTGAIAIGLAFNPKLAWIVVETENKFILWDYENKNKK